MNEKLSADNLKRLPEKNRKEAERIVENLLLWLKDKKKQINGILLKKK